MSVRICMQPDHRRGYTLIELVIVIAILGLAGALIIPQLVDGERFDTQAAVRRAIGDLSFAQSDALAQQEMRRVHFYEDGSGYCIIRVTEQDFNEEFDPDTAEYILDPMGGASRGGLYIVDYNVDDRFQHVTIDEVSLDGGGRDIVYDQLGGTIADLGIPGSGGSFVIRSENTAYRVSVEAFTGKMSVTRLE